jgi:hypothetical protein
MASKSLKRKIRADRRRTKQVLEAAGSILVLLGPPVNPDVAIRTLWAVVGLSGSRFAPLGVRHGASKGLKGWAQWWRWLLGRCRDNAPAIPGMCCFTIVIIIVILTLPAQASQWATRANPPFTQRLITHKQQLRIVLGYCCASARCSHIM